MTTSSHPPPRANGSLRDPPERVGRYDVVRLLGQGGMGRVWLARDSVLARNVAIKVLRDDLALPPTVRAELIERMRHEARAAAAVSHPNIVTLHDMGEDGTVGLYLVFEYVPCPREPALGEIEGPESLRDRLREGILPLAEVARLARELGSALSFAHEAGVIHRDIKPENVLFSRTGAKIADFGIARIPESTITRQNTVLGTPAYTAPEALSRGEFGPKSDQFALAATLYEALTGVRAFGSEDPLVTVARVSNEPPTPLDPSLGSPAILRALTRALEKGLAKSEGDRFASCADLGDAIARAIEWPPLEDAPPADTPSTERIEIEIERPPLSSRVALAERVSRLSDRPGTLPILAGAETPLRASLYVRKKTERAQNIAVALSLLVIVLLFFLGRKSPEERAARNAAIASAAAASASAAAAAAMMATAPVPHRPRPAPSARPSASTITPAAPGVDASTVEEPKAATEQDGR
ncbi:putative serine/threonine protein kinase [Labilithrix luteola]|uniref:Putative serine/threonine protein kinase n=1 Tax=Labilithrix luteola TaxID=1391654 RepID=A0A0K1Q6I4_9BACT|nr:serine/threonine-protein kinase [Labilithrix luteola]AKV01252.1 putative serine/threonine protein kinase [Labilithrix luteola]